MPLRKSHLFLKSFSTSTPQSTSLNWRTQLKQSQLISQISSTLLQRRNWAPLLSTLNLSSSILTPPLFLHILHRTQSNPQLSLTFFNWARTNLGFKPDLKTLSKLTQILIGSGLASQSKPMLDSLIQTYPPTQIVDSAIHACRGELFDGYQQCPFVEFQLDCILYWGCVITLLLMHSSHRIMYNSPYFSFFGSESMRQNWLRIIPSFASNSITSSAQRSLCTHQLPADVQSIHTLPEELNGTVNSICDSLRKGLNWDALSRRYSSVELSNSMVEKVLLQLKEPIDAKCTLGFFHWSAQQKHFKHETSSYCIVIHILVRAKLIRDARTLLESVLKKSISGNSSRFSVVVSLLNSYKNSNSIPLVFDLLVQTYAKLRMIDSGFDVCQYLNEHGFTLSVISYNTLINVVQKSDQTSLVWKIYEYMIQKRTYPNGVTVRMMINALCKEGKLQETIDMLDRIHGKRCSPAVIVNTSLVFRILDERRVDEGMVLLKRMLQKNMILDTVSYSMIVYARVKLGSLDSAWEVYEEMLKRGFHANPFVYTSFIKAYCMEGRIDGAIWLMQDMKNLGLKPFSETFDHLIVGCSHVGRLEESVKFCEKTMEMNFVPSCLAFNEMVGKLCETGRTRQANEMLTNLLDKGFEPDQITYSRLIAGYAKEGNIQEVLKLYYEMEYRSLSPGSLVFASLISCLCQCGKFDEAEKYLKVMKDRSIPPSAYIYETLIVCHNMKGNKSRARQFYREMVGVGLEPSDSCCCVGAEELQS